MFIKEIKISFNNYKMINESFENINLPHVPIQMDFLEIKI